MAAAGDVVGVDGVHCLMVHRVVDGRSPFATGYDVSRCYCCYNRSCCYDAADVVEFEIVAAGFVTTKTNDDIGVRYAVDSVVVDVGACFL